MVLAKPLRRQIPAGSALLRASATIGSAPPRMRQIGAPQNASKEPVFGGYLDRLAGTGESRSDGFVGRGCWANNVNSQ